MVLKSVLICLSAILVTTHGKPEAPLPYYYPTPSIDQNFLTKTRNFASTANQASGQTALLSQAYIPTSGQQNYNNLIPTNSYGTPILRTSNIGQNIALPHKNYGTPDQLYSNQLPVAYRSQPESSVSIQKHIYVHVAPPDVDEETAQRIQQQETRQKHYKIIFVKVPTYPSPAPYIAQQQALKEEKTLIYVLVKKPEEPLAVAANQVANTPINKPEVYFIKYKAKSDQTSHIGGQNLLQQTESVQENNENDSVVIESAFGGATRQSQQGYSYDRPARVLN